MDRSEPLREPVLGLLHERGSDAGVPPLGIDADRIDLAHALLVSARPDHREADDVAVVFEDEHRTFRVPEDPGLFVAEGGITVDR